MNMASADDISARSKKELIDCLKSRDITIPARTKGRTTPHCERRGAFRLLASLATADCLGYPVGVIHRDKPDFLLQFGNRPIGLEFTEAVSQEDAEIDALATRMDKSILLFSDQFKRDTPKRTAKQRREIIKNPPPGGPGWGDDRGIPEWVEWMMSFIEKKTGDLAKPDFDRRDENWLLVYDNLPVPFARDALKRWPDLNEVLNRYFADDRHYDKIFVDSASTLAEFTPTGWTIQLIVDLWKHMENP